MDKLSVIRFSVSSKVILFVLTLVVFSLLMSCDSNKLTRSKAEEMINDYFASQVRVHDITVGAFQEKIYVKNYKNNEQPCLNLDSFNIKWDWIAPLVEQEFLTLRLIDKHANKSWYDGKIESFDITCYIETTEKINPYINSVREGRLKENQWIVTLVTGSRALHEVTGIKNPIDRTVAIVEFNYYIIPSVVGDNFYAAGDLLNIQNESVSFVLYDDGWRINN